MLFVACWFWLVRWLLYFDVYCGLLIFGGFACLLMCVTYLFDYLRVCFVTYWCLMCLVISLVFVWDVLLVTWWFVRA